MPYLLKFKYEKHFSFIFWNWSNFCFAIKFFLFKRKFSGGAGQFNRIAAKGINIIKFK